jgi:o-succinylbenzoate synthase
MLKASYKKHTLIFKTPVGTSRGVLETKDSWFLSVWDAEHPDVVGMGECSIIPDLSIDDTEMIEPMLDEVCDNIDSFNDYLDEILLPFPAIRFALETAIYDLSNGGKQVLFASEFTNGIKGIPINGLIWMGDEAKMREQMEFKINHYPCLKMKIGAISFDREIAIIKWLRETYGNEFELRVDANGAFSYDEVDARLEELSKYNIHSIEQPIKQGQWNKMAKLCEKSPIPIVLDEELIGIDTLEMKRIMLQTIKPQYIIIKPSLVGGFESSEDWISLAKDLNIDWWITSALESNIGLNAIAQWTYELKTTMPQGLGTGELYINNIDSPLYIANGELWYETIPQGDDIVLNLN